MFVPGFFFWSRARCDLQGMPCVNGEPREFDMQDNFTTKIKAVLPEAKVHCPYRIVECSDMGPSVQAPRRPSPKKTGPLLPLAALSEPDDHPRTTGRVLQC